MTFEPYEIEIITVHPRTGKGSIHVHRNSGSHGHVTFELDCSQHPALSAVMPQLVDACKAALTECMLEMGGGFTVPDAPPNPALPCRICGRLTDDNREVSPGRWRCPEHVPNGV